MHELATPPAPENGARGRKEVVWHQGQEHALCNQTEGPGVPAPPLTCCVTSDKSPQCTYNMKAVLIPARERGEDSKSLMTL